MKTTCEIRTYLLSISKNTTINEVIQKTGAALIVDRDIRILEDAGANVTVRRTLGGDVDASCGQLRKKVAENRA